MPKCANVVILVIVTNIVTLTIFSNIKYEKLPSLSEAVSIIPGYSNSGGQNGGVEHIRWVKIKNIQNLNFRFGIETKVELWTLFKKGFIFCSNHFFSYILTKWLTEPPKMAIF